MKAVFIGTVIFSRKALVKLLDLGVDIRGVITKEHSAFNSDFCDLTDICRQNRIQVIYPDDINSEDVIQWIKSRHPDVIFCFGWSWLLKKKILEIPTIGVVGFHPAQLPLNRGRHPLIWALALGLSETASTFFFMEQGADSGDILSQEKIKILYNDDASTLYEKVSKKALSQIEEFIPLLKSGNFPRIKQDHTIANIWRKRGKEDGKIDFRMSSRSIYNLVRALTKPYPGAHIEYKEQEIKVWKVCEKECKQNNLEPGKILDITKREIEVKAGENSVILLRHEFQNYPKVGEYFL